MQLVAGIIIIHQYGLHLSNDLTDCFGESIGLGRLRRKWYGPFESDMRTKDCVSNSKKRKYFVMSSFFFKKNQIQGFLIAEKEIVHCLDLISIPQ